jgi:hypothetical protein
MVDICIHNQPSKHSAKEDRKVVAALTCAWCTKHGSLWIRMMQAWFVWCIKDENVMLVCGTFFHEFQSRCFTRFHGPWVLYLKRFIMKGQYWLSIMIESNIIRASGKRLKFGRDGWWSFAFTYVKRIFRVNLLRVEKSTTSMRTSSGDANKDTCIIFLSGSWLGRGFTSRGPEPVMEAVEANSLTLW